MVFTGIARGNMPLSIALLPWNLLLQLVLLPVYLLILAGTLVPIELKLIGKSIMVAFVVPFLSAFVIRHIIVRLKRGAWFENRLIPKLQSVQIVFLGLAITAMFTSEGAVMMEKPWILFRLLPPILLFFLLNLGFVFLIGRIFRVEYKDFVSLCCTILARNSPLALVIALVAFPDEPLIALALVIGPMIELPMLGVVSQILLWIRSHRFL